ILAISEDHGQNWHDVKHVGAAAGINTTVFSEAAAGDDNRAAFAFLGTSSIGSLGARTFPGAWTVSVAATYAGPSTWPPGNTTPIRPPSMRRRTPSRSEPRTRPALHAAATPSVHPATEARARCLASR